MTPRRALWLLIALSGLIRLVWSASLGPGNDEAYHYLFTVHRDWSYFDHPPMVAVVESLGLALGGGVVTVFTLRLGFVLLFAGSTFVLARLTARIHGEGAGLLAAFALNVSAYYTAAAGAFALPDGPLLFFWLLTLDRLTVALGLTQGTPDEPPRAIRSENLAWMQVGFAWGGALLSKYHAVFLPAGALLYLAVDPTSRRWLRRPGPYIAAAVGLVLFAPVLVWNAMHGWISFAFQGSRAIGAGFRIDTLLGALVLPALYLFPWIWVALVRELVRRGPHLSRKDISPADRFFLCQAFLPLGAFLTIACTRPILPHWVLVGFLPLFPMLGRTWNKDRKDYPRRFRRKAVVLALVPVALGLFVLTQARKGFVWIGRSEERGQVARLADPTADLVGWKTVADELRRRGLLDQPGTFLFTGSWYQSGQLAFATRGSTTPVLCYHAWDARGFAFWSRPEEWVGHDGIYVLVNGQAKDSDRYNPWFTKVEPLGGFEVHRAGASVREVSLYRCVRQRVPFPFDDLGRTVHSKKRRHDPRLMVPVATASQGNGNE
ncbi:MAG: hypothetical protein NVSMB9_21840 [Isosphaeraceae bacterium]